VKKTKTRRIILLSLISFFAVILSLLIRANITYSNEENVYIFEDLKVGDYIPVGATIQVGEDFYKNYFINSGMYVANSYGNSAKVVYSLNSDLLFKSQRWTSLTWTSLKKGECETISSNNAIQTESIENIYSSLNYDSEGVDFDSYIGWIVNEVFDNYVVLVPTTDYSRINSTPSLENEYVIDTTLLNTEDSEVENKWYLFENITNYEVSDSNFWQNDAGVIHFLYKGDGEVGDTYTLTYTFEAEAGDIITFDTRSWSGATFYGEKSSEYSESYDTYEIKFNGNTLSYPTGYKLTYYEEESEKFVSAYQENALYEKVNIEVTESGTQILSFTYTINDKTVVSDVVETDIARGSRISGITSRYSYNYAYVKGIKLLTPINEGKQLDTSKLNDGDEILYRSTSNTTDYTLEERITYTSIIENPNTGIFIPLIFILILIILIFLIKHKTKFIPINKL